MTAAVYLACCCWCAGHGSCAQSRFRSLGAGNFFLFGLTADQVTALRGAGYSPRTYYDNDAELKAAVDALVSGAFSGRDREAFEPVIGPLLNRAEYMVFADYRSYVDCHDRAGAAWADQDQWTRMSILNTARSGFFSSDGRCAATAATSGTPNRRP